MRTQPRSAALVTAVLLAAGSPLAASGLAGLSVAYGDEVPAEPAQAAEPDQAAEPSLAAEPEADPAADRTNSPEYTASREDYWEARAAYRARKAATQARKAGVTDAGGDPAAEPGGGSSGFDAAVLAAPAAAAEPEAAVEPGWGPSAEAWAALRECESGNDYGINTGNGYYGAYQFSPVTWWWLGYEGYPHQAPPWVQDQAALELWGIYGWSPWPGCSRALGFL
jgi:hypothetical protein